MTNVNLRTHTDLFNFQMETSTEASHSEGELYMPSSCSYSLGEVRILKKRDFIVDSTTDRDSSTTVLITRSMLTSLNDSTVVSASKTKKRTANEVLTGMTVLNFHFFCSLYLEIPDTLETSHIFVDYIYFLMISIFFIIVTMKDFLI